MFSNQPSISMKKTMITRAPTRRSAANNNVSVDEQIAQRGCGHGDDLADWFQVEIEINRQHRKQARRKASRSSGESKTRGAKTRWRARDAVQRLDHLRAALKEHDFGNKMRQELLAFFNV
jgi:hypothetical protein